VSRYHTSRTSSPVGKAVVDAVSWKLLGGGSGENKVSLDASVHNLNDDLLVGEADNQAVFRCIAAKQQSYNLSSAQDASTRTICSWPG
jgi:hypothetical protein